ncbi:MAG: arsenic transporter [Oscillospiraceae bacterium]|jgi:Na+/H+ antiporter NhaD/arsenite permease-like protein|nr:arsenic transporter [Oscillospiraceae bacterium]
MSFITEKLGENGTLIAAIVLFAITYIGMIVFSKYRAQIAVGSAVLFILLGILPFGDVPGTINWNVLMMLAGTMGTVALFIESKMPAKMADWIIDKSPSLKWAIILLSLFAGVVSAFVDNVATLLMIAPVAMDICKKLKVSPVPVIISIAIASNLEGAATLVGDTTSILLGGHMNMSFNDFFFYTPPGETKAGLGLFFLVQIAFIVATCLLLWIFRKETQKVHLEEKAEVKDYLPTILLLGTVLCLIFASFLPDTITLGSRSFVKPETINGIICVAFYVIGLLWYLLFKKKTEIIKSSLKEIDVFTLVLLASLFLVVGGLSASGAVVKIGETFAHFSGGNVFVVYTILVWFSVIISAFVDNIPYVATMLPVVSVIAQSIGVPPTVLYFGLISGATLGGNITPIGASTNIAATGILRKAGHNVSLGQYMKLSVPYTLAAVAVGYILTWFCWRYTVA